MSLLTESGLTPEEEFLQGSPLALNATKITVAGVMPFITDEALEKKLKRFGRFASGFWTVNLGCEDERLKHVQSMNRQVFMYLDSPTQTLEVSFRVKHGGVSYGVYASSGTLRCVGCGDVGQNPVDCPHRQQIPKPAEDDSGEGRNAVAGSPVTASSANPGPADRGSGSITATLPGDHPATNPCSSIGPSEETAPAVPPSQSNSNFSHPVYKEISLANGQINRMSMHELRLKLSELQLDTRGVKDVMKKRLKSHYKKQKLMQTVPEGGPTDTYYDYICVVDFEATCEEDNPSDFQHEIIEFPMVLINTHTLEIVDTFQEYVKPELNPELSDFCVKLTGITQKMVDQADSFPEVLERVVAWLQERELGTKYKYAILTDGAWDMSKFLNIQCQLSRIKYPPFAKKWINIRKSYGNFYKVPRTQTKLSTMLEKLGLKYEGRPHSGLDDSRNIARIAIRMLQDGCQLRVNERIHGGQLHTVPSSVPVEGAPPPRKPRSRD